MKKSAAPALHEDELIWQFFGRRTNGFFVEVGANEPQGGSQTWFFEQHGWRGILVEPQSRLCERLRSERPHSQVFQVACGAPGHPKELPFYVAETSGHSSLAKNLIDPNTHYVGTELVKVMTLDDVLAEAGVPHVDFISIDVEGTQLDVLRGFDLRRHRPALLLLEDHLHNLQVHQHVRRQGYRLVKRTGLNNWYIPADQPFTMTTMLERFRLWKKVWANTPFRKLRVFLAHRRAAREQRPAS
ncbi:MAG: FkbM family methyltransferase [Verrucomicrobia bacterium]|nr:FkbM family methyltransferase [Verrucomicrobiota bacterium]